jgi:hypothetical protein
MDVCGYLQNAVAPLKQVKQLAPDNSEVRYNLGIAFALPFAFREGVAELEAAESMNSNSTGSSVFRGCVR